MSEAFNVLCAKGEGVCWIITFDDRSWKEAVNVCLWYWLQCDLPEQMAEEMVLEIKSKHG